MAKQRERVATDENEVKKAAKSEVKEVVKHNQTNSTTPTQSVPEGEERFATKQEILKGLRRQYNNHRISYKEYMLQVKKTEKYYDQWLKDYENQKNGVSEVDTTNEELAIGKKLNELQTKETPVQSVDETPYEEVNSDEKTTPDEEKTED